jgi:hypothetical protein
MATIKELKAELKAKGIKGITGKKKAEFMAMLAKQIISRTCTGEV